MANVVDIIVRGQDNASNVLQSVGNSAKNLGQTIKANLGKITAISGAIATGIVAMSKNFIDEANAQIRVNTQLESVLKSTKNAVGLTAKEIQDMASALQKETTIADDAIQTGQNMLLTFTNIGKDVFPEATKTLLDMATAMNNGATPSAEQLSQQAIQLGKALNDPVQGINALRRVGVSFTDDQIKVIQKLVETGDTVKAQKLILEELSKEFGGSASAQAETFQGKLLQLKNTFSDLKEGIGMAMIPVLERLAERLTPIIDKIVSRVEKNPELMANIIMIAGLVAGLVTVLGTIGLVLPSVIAGFTLFNAVLIANPIGAVITSLALLIGGLKLLSDNLPTYEQRMNNYKKEIEQLNEDYKKGLVPQEEYEKKLDDLTTAMNNTEEKSKTLSGTIRNDFAQTIYDMAHPIEAGKKGLEAFGNIVNSIGASFDNVAATIGNFVLNVITYLYNETSNILGSLSGVLNAFVNNVKSTFNGMVDWIVTIVNKVRDAVAQIKALIASIPSKAMSIAGNIGNAASSVFKASGGPVQAGQQYIVGEQGPEKFIPTVPGYIVPNNKLLGGTSVSISLGGVVINNDADENRLVDKIKKTLTRELELYKMGVY